MFIILDFFFNCLIIDELLSVDPSSITKILSGKRVWFKKLLMVFFKYFP